MSLKELREIAKECGVAYRVGMTKRDLTNILAWGSLVDSSPWGHKRVGHDLETKHQQLRADFTRMNRMTVVYFKWFLFLFSCGKLEGIFL